MWFYLVEPITLISPRGFGHSVLRFFLSIHGTDMARGLLLGLHACGRLGDALVEASADLVLP